MTSDAVTIVEELIELETGEVVTSREVAGPEVLRCDACETEAVFDFCGHRRCVEHAPEELREALAEVEALRAELARLQMPIVIGRGKVVVGSASYPQSDVGNLVVVSDASRPLPIGAGFSGSSLPSDRRVIFEVVGGAAGVEVFKRVLDQAAKESEKLPPEFALASGGSSDE